MQNRIFSLLLALFMLSVAACGNKETADVPATPEAPEAPATPEAPEAPAAPEVLSSTTTDSGLVIELLAEGEGEPIASGEVAAVHYTGWLYDENAPDNRGEKFDSSYDRDDPIRFPVGTGRVIPGWDEGILGMKVGEHRILTIAPGLGYGARQVGPIPPNSTLIFDVKLVGINP